MCIHEISPDRLYAVLVIKNIGVQRVCVSSCIVTRFLFYKKLGSAPSTKSFLISHENFPIIVRKVS